MPAGLHGLADDGRRQSASWKHAPRSASFQLAIALRSGERSFLVRTRPGGALRRFVASVGALNLSNGSSDPTRCRHFDRLMREPQRCSEWLSNTRRTAPRYPAPHERSPLHFTGRASLIDANLLVSFCLLFLSGFRCLNFFTIGFCFCLKIS